MLKQVKDYLKTHAKVLVKGRTFTVTIYSDKVRENKRHKQEYLDMYVEASLKEKDQMILYVKQ